MHIWERMELPELIERIELPELIWERIERIWERMELPALILGAHLGAHGAPGAHLGAYGAPGVHLGASRPHFGARAHLGVLRALMSDFQ